MGCQRIARPHGPLNVRAPARATTQRITHLAREAGYFPRESNPVRLRRRLCRLADAQHLPQNANIQPSNGFLGTAQSGQVLDEHVASGAIRFVCIVFGRTKPASQHISAPPQLSCCGCALSTASIVNRSLLRRAQFSATARSLFLGPAGLLSLCLDQVGPPPVLLEVF